MAVFGALLLVTWYVISLRGRSHNRFPKRWSRRRPFSNMPKSGGECIAHSLQALTDFDPRATVLSIDGIGAFDLISRGAMLDGLRSVAGGDSVLPFVVQFYGNPSSYLWDDDDGETHEIKQGEGGKQGDLLMPMLYALGQHQTLRSVQSRLHPHERLLAFLDDVYAIAQPERIVEVHRILGEELWQHSRIRIKAGKTQIWNRGGHVPSGYETLLNQARAINPHAEVWFGGADRPPEVRGIRVLGTPIGTAEYVKSQLEATEAAHQLLLQRISAVQDLQSAWLLLSFCVSTRATFYLRVYHPDHSEAFARQHDVHIWQCLSTLLGQRQHALPKDWGSLPFHLGGLGLRSAHRSAHAAFWGSWADCLHIINQRHGDIARTMLDALENPPAFTVHIQAAVSCRLQLAEVGFEYLDWQALLDGLRPRQVNLDEMDPGVPIHGWQFFAAQASEKHFRTEVLWPYLAPTQQTLMRSQSGPFAGLPFFPPQLFRVLLLRRLWLPLPLSSRTCRCGRPLDVLGHPRSVFEGRCTGKSRLLCRKL